MSAVPHSDVLAGLTTWLGSLPELSGFTITDRPAGLSTIPDIRLGPVDAVPWDTGTSRGSEYAVTLTILTQLGSFAMLNAAVDAICDGFPDAALALTNAKSVVQRAASAKTDHDPAQNIERATLILTLLIDQGDVS